jgi:hypothetical protein
VHYRARPYTHAEYFDSHPQPAASISIADGRRPRDISIADHVHDRPTATRSATWSPLTAGRSPLVARRSPLADGRWSMVDGRWSMVDGRILTYQLSGRKQLRSNARIPAHKNIFVWST